MTKDQYSAYLASADWQQRRTHLILTRGSRCQQCGALGMVEAHHLHYRNVGHERDEDLILLCRRCHLDAHGIEATADTLAPAQRQPEPAL